MSSNNVEMWKALGLDLDSHDLLLGVLGQACTDIFLSMKNRPEGMQYFDFMMSEIHGLRVKELVEARADGRKVIGCYCVFVPEEITIAADAIQVGLSTGIDFAKEEVEKYIPRDTCCLIKSAIGFKLGKVCPYLECSDMVVGENSCDGKKKAYESLATMMNMYVMDMPQMRTEAGRALLKSEFYRYKDAVERLTGKKIDFSALKKGIFVINAKRKALQRLAALRKKGVVAISGLDALLVNQVSFYDDPVRFTESVNRICDELEIRIKENNSVLPVSAPKLVVSGCPMAVSNWKIPLIVETSGAAIVAEESCVGERGMRNLVDDSANDLEGLMDALVERYFQVACAVFTPNQERIAHIIDMMEDTRAAGVILYGLNFCQPYLMEAVSIEKVLERKGIPSIRIETDYGPEDTDQLKTRIGAFIEMVS